MRAHTSIFYFLFIYAFTTGHVYKISSCKERPSVPISSGPIADPLADYRVKGNGQKKDLTVFCVRRRPFSFNLTGLLLCARPSASNENGQHPQENALSDSPERFRRDRFSRDQRRFQNLYSKDSEEMSPTVQPALVVDAQLTLILSLSTL